MTTALQRLAGLAAVALSAGVAVGMGAVLLGRRSFRRLVRSDIQTLFASASTARRAGVVTEEMLAGLPAPVRLHDLHRCGDVQ